MGTAGSKSYVPNPTDIGFDMVVTTLALDSQPRQRLVKVWAKSEA
jgi:hypothetical protein